MGTTREHAIGSPNWFELATTDQTGARTFYCDLFGWAAVDNPIADGQTYTIFEHHGAEVAACYSMMPEQIAAGAPPHWGVYFRVEDCDAAAAAAVRLGGQVLAAPFDVMEHLRMAVVADPSGAVFQLSQPRLHPGVGAIREDQAITWVELATSDLGGAEAFYSELLGWTIDPHQNSPMPYRLIASADGNFGGMMQMSEQWGSVPAHWSIYVQVADVDATLAKALQLGGTVSVPAFDVPEVGRMGQFADPSGARMYVIRLVAPGSSR